MKREIHIQMYPEQGFILHRIKFTIEGLVVFILEFTRSSGPQRLYVVDNIVIGCLNLLAILPFLFLAAGNLDWQETTVFLEQALDRGLLQILLAVIIQIKDNISTAVCLIGIRELKFRRSVTAPFHSLGTFLI